VLANIKYTFFLIFFSTCLSHAQTNVPPTFKMDGKAALMSNFFQDGINHTDKDPALQAQFWFNWGPQFRLGLWGSNTKYSSSDTHFWLRASGDLKVIFSENADMTLRLHSHNYFKSNDRNGISFVLLLNLFTYYIQVEQQTNFLGTLERATLYSASKTYDVFGDWKNENTLGYAMLNSSTLVNYFWIESWLGKKPGAIYYQVGASYNSKSSQLNGAADFVFAAKATASF
jgi:hypothetical protein